MVLKLRIGVYMFRTDETEKSCVLQNVKLSKLQMGNYRLAVGQL